MDAVREANRKQAVVPARGDGARPRRHGARAWSCRRGGLRGRPSWSCRGRRASCSRCGAPPSRRRRFAPRSRGAVDYETGDAAAVRDPGVRDRRDAAPRARRRRRHRRAGDHDLPAPRRGRGRDALRAVAAGALYEAFAAVVRERHPDTLFSDDGTTVDEQVADAAARSAAGRSRRRSRARAGCSPPASPTRPAPRTTSRAASSSTTGLRRRSSASSPATLDAHGEVSVEVARELAERVRERRGSEVGVGITGIAGPGGGTPEKPVGPRLLLASPGRTDRSRARRRCPAAAFDVRDRSTTVAMHLVRRLLLGEHD